MHRFLAIIAASIAALAMSLALSTSANAASPSQTECEASGGTFDRTQGTVTCTYPTVSDPVGNSEKSGGKSQTVDTTEEESSKGTLNNKPKHEETSECTGPGNGNSSAQCP
ncbi:MAG: hypothetical protein Q8Q02_15090 [Nocardioides sp.]|nr:hypothetical protein [Nocardioides sp.]